MSAEYSVDAAFDAWVATLPDKHWAKYDISACRLGWEAQKAERIEADERSVPAAEIEHFVDRVSEMRMMPEAILLGIGKHRLFTYPPAQAARVDNPPRLGGCCCGEPCTLGVVHRTDGPCFVYTQPADSGRVDDEEADKAAARAMDRVAAKHGMHALEINPDVTAHHTLRRELVRAGYALAAQGQGEATCKHPLQVAGYSATEDACRKAFREEDGYGEERLRSRDYRVFRDGFFCGVHQLFGNPEELPKSEPAAWIIRKRNTHPMDSIPWCTTHDGDAAEHIERGDDVTPLYTHPAPPASPAAAPSATPEGGEVQP